MAVKTVVCQVLMTVPTLSAQMVCVTGIVVSDLLSCVKICPQVSCSAQLRLKFILLINVKMPTIVDILTFMSWINYRLWHSKPSILMYLDYYGIYMQFKFYAQLS